MTRLIGRQVAVGIGRETVRGTAVAPDFFLQWMDTNVETKNEIINDESSLGVLEDSDAANIVATWGEGTIKGKLKDESFGLILDSLMGDRVDAMVEAGVFDHTYTLGQTTTHPSLSVAVVDANINEVYPNSVIDSVKLDVELGNYIMMEAAFMGRRDQAAANILAITQERDFVPQMFSFRRATDITGLDAAPNIDIRNLSIEFKNNLLIENVLGNVDANEIVNQQFAVEGSITLVHNDTTFEDLQNNETYQAMRFDITHSDLIGAASNPRLRIELNRARIFDYDRSLTQNDLIEETFSFKGFYSIADGDAVTIALRNELASY